MASNNNQSFKIWFKTFLIRRDLKLCGVAEKLGISASHLSNIVNGRKQAKGNFCSHFKAVYKEDISQFWPETPEEKINRLDKEVYILQTHVKFIFEVLKLNNIKW